MDKFLFFLVFLFQANLFAQDTEATLIVNGSTQFEDYGQIVQQGIIKDHDVIKFRISSKGKADIWNETKCKGIFLMLDDIQHEYRYVTIRSNDFHPVLLKVFSEGTVTLYGRVAKKVHSQPNDYGLDRKYVDPDIENVTFYLKRENDEYAGKLWGLFNWKKMTKDYFKDCPELIEKIESKEFTSKNIPEMVDFYNNICGE
ncbi:hypothetical protein HYN48_11750 [Flavobacterium magnum]|uniref:DUF4369 domain-containing protein n=1 Tax=Flavobacterium magnum TaxID=2162713 RepID=A0A2S0RGG0_9FLAO|nr:hypothetical protein [Flavobacterium magnum]AWA30705.1 hypothetical protein HYN48_11750 [Flavobacterium magnum]